MNTTDKINDARALLTEQAGKIGTPLATYIEEYINSSKLTTIDAAAKVSDKNLKDLTDRIREEARKTAKGSVGMISDEDVREMTDEFYGFISDGEDTNSTDKLDIFDML